MKKTFCDECKSEVTKYIIAKFDTSEKANDTQDKILRKMLSSELHFCSINCLRRYINKKSVEPY